MMFMDEPEGATLLNRDETEGLKFKHITTRDSLNHLEQVNIQSGMSWVYKTRRSDFLTESFVRELHKKLFGEVWTWAGVFRRTGKNIGVDPLYIGVELRMLLGDMHYWITHETYPAKESVMRFHHRLVFIHPFVNGNGRHARIMADALLIRLFQQTPIDWAGGYDLCRMNERRNAYIQALRSADQGDYTALFRFAGIISV